MAFPIETVWQHSRLIAIISLFTIVIYAWFFVFEQVGRVVFDTEFDPGFGIALFFTVLFALVIIYLGGSVYKIPGMAVDSALISQVSGTL